MPNHISTMALIPGSIPGVLTTIPGIKVEK